MKSKAIILNYEGNEITFGVGEDVWINATEMSKMFDKQARDFLKTAQTQEYIKIYSTKTKILLTDIVKVVNGGVHNGTWMRRKLALRFAQWLSAEFAFWVDEQIEKLLTTGKVEIKPSSEVTLPNFADPVAAARAWADAEEAKLIAQKQVAELQPKADYADKVLISNSPITTNTIANELGMSARALNAELHKKRVIYKQGEKWYLYSEYRGMGLDFTDTFVKEHEEGFTSTHHHLKWTEEGRMFIHRLLNPGVFNLAIIN